MKRKAIAAVLIFCLVLCMMSLTTAAKPNYLELNPDDFVLEYSSDQTNCPDDNQYDFAIFSRTVSGKFLFVPKYTVQLVFLVSDAEGNVRAGYASESTFWFNEPDDIQKAIKKDKKLKKVADLYEQVVEAEFQFLILEEVEAGKDETPEDQLERLAALKEKLLGDFEGVVSDFQYEFLEFFLTSAIDEANSVFQSASDADPVIEFFKMIFFDLFGLGDEGEDFSSHIAKMAGKSALSSRDSITGILYDNLEVIDPDGIYSIYKDRYTIGRGDIVQILLELDETP